MKEKLMNNIVLKIGAVLLAILIWIVVVNTDNPVTSKIVSGIPITYENADEVFGKNGMTFEEIDGVEMVSVRVYARRLDLPNIKTENFTAVVDCTKITDFNGAVKVEVTYNGAASLIERFEVVNDTIRICSEKMVSKEWNIEYEVTGTPKEGYTVGDVTLSPNVVEVTAPESVMEAIASVKVSVDVDGADSEIIRDVALTYYDAYGKAIVLSEDDRLTASSSGTRIRVAILKTNQVAIDYFSVKGTDAVADGYRYIGVECNTPSVSVKGLKSAMADLNKITIPSEELDVTDAAGDVVKEIDIRPYLPGNVEVVGSSIVKVTMKVEKLVTKEFLVNKNLIQLNGMDEDHYHYEVMPGDTTYRVTIQGLDEDLRTLMSASLQLSLDLTGYTEGTHEVTPVLLLDDGFTVVSMKPVTVVITKQEEPETGGTDEPDSPEESTAEPSSEASSGSASSVSRQR